MDFGFTLWGVAQAMPKRENDFLPVCTKADVSTSKRQAMHKLLTERLIVRKRKGVSM
jgi:hypothetical protein